MKNNWLWLGPVFVVFGAGLWGLESFFRVHLNEFFSPTILVLIEHVLGIFLTVPFLIASRHKLKKIPPKAWFFIILSGSLGSAVGTTFFTMALKEMNASVANLLLKLQPVFCVLFARLILKEKWGKDFVKWALVALASGVAIALSGNEVDLQNFSLDLGLIFISITAMTWGFSTVAGRGAMIHIPASVAVPVRFIVGFFTLLLMAGAKGELDLAALNPNRLLEGEIFWNYLGLVTIAGVLPTFLYLKGLAHTSATVGGFCEMTQTFVAVLVSWVALGQPLMPLQLLGGLVLLWAVYKINLDFAKANKKS
ncbi:MAG: DMT family transporter [Oligoflexia bacterium]|nr:DMT family transporter [Oligoflexia bacterium]